MHAGLQVLLLDDLSREVDPVNAVAFVANANFELLGVKRCLPCHWGTFPPLVGRPAQLRELAPDVEIEDVEPGGSVTV